MTTLPGYEVTAAVCEANDLWLYQAIRRQDGRPVLLKVPPGSGRPTLALVGRLQHELELARDLDASRMVRPLVIERHGDHVALVLEHGPTETLAARLGHRMNLDEFLPLAIGINSALDELHRHGVVHKDIKPDNVLLDVDGHVWLTGLGIATCSPRERQGPESPEIIAGTLAYMAPEQTGRMNRSIDSRSDLYALGVTFYQMLTGVLPFSAADPMELVHCHIARQATPPMQRVPGLPEPISEMVMRLLAKNAEQRYQSTAGLDADLRRCLAQWHSDRCITPFPLGEHDLSDCLLVPETLYGRTPEISVLLAAFGEVVASGASQFVLVSGYSGVGKTSVVHELHKALVPHRGLFAVGKFDQFKRDIPYGTLVQALQTLMRGILAKGETEVQAWRIALQEAVGPNGQLMVGLIPELELIVGKQAAVPDLPPQESQNRFQMVLRRFLAAVARPEHPLALFLDDLQWLDAATLQLIEQLATGQDVRHLLLIGAYRDNELAPSHPLMRTFDAIRRRTDVREIVLAPLGLEHLGALVADSLHCEPARALPLARLVHEKTGGNPFFAIQFLTALAEDKLLAFDPDARRWRWDLERIQAKGFTDNVVDLMVRKLGRLPAATLAALERFACLGSEADIDTLAAAHGQSEEALHATLVDAVRAGLVFRHEKTYAFLHDRVREAAYALVPEARRKTFHLSLGRLLLSRSSQELLMERVFDIVDQFNRSVELVTDVAERETVRRLNAAAGRKARAAVAYASAQRYYAQALALLPADCWKGAYAETIALFTDLAQCEYLLGEYRHSEELLTQAMQNARVLLDRVLVSRLRQRLYQHSAHWAQAATAALEALKLLDVSFPENDEEIRRATEFEKRKIQLNLQGRRIADLADVPFTDDVEAQAVIGLLAESITQFFVTRPLLWHLIVLRCVNLCLERGNVEESPYIFSSYCKLLVAQYDDINSAFEFSRMSLRLNECLKGGFMKGLPPFFHASVVSNWREHFRVNLALFDEAYQAFLDSGAVIWANYLTYNAVWLHVENGDQLSQVVELARRYANFNRLSHNDVVHAVVRLEEQFALALQGKTRSLTDFDDADFDEATAFAAIERASFGIGICYYCIIKQIAAFIDAQFEESLQWAVRVQPVLASASSMAIWGSHHFFHALAMASLHDRVAEERRQEFSGKLTGILAKLRSWADNCPENFANRYDLLCAELARLEGRDLDAMRLYDQAIRSARDNDFVHQEAIAAEVASRFYRDRGLDRIADAYLGDALAGYSHWGAHGKVRRLEQRYPQLRASSATGAAAGNSAAGVQELDSRAIVRASQAISGEILLDKLLKTLMRIVLEDAGARQGQLLLIRGDELELAAEARVEEQNIVTQVPGERTLAAEGVPASVLNYVRRSGDHVLLDAAGSDNPYGADEYFSRHRPKSVLCLPIVRQTKLLGLLYLENDLATHAFTPERLAIVELLAAQAAISLENAVVHETLRENEAQYRSLIEAIPNPFYYKDDGGRIQACNVAYERYLGRGRDEIIGRTAYELVPRELADIYSAADRSLFDHPGTQVIETKARWADGSLRDVVLHKATVAGADGSPIGIAGIVFDISDRKSTEEQLRKLSLAVEQSPASIIITDLKANIEYVNEAFVRSTGFRRDEVVGRNPRLLQSGSTPPEAYVGLWNALTSGTSWIGEFRNRRKDGSELIELAHITPIRQPDGNTSHYLSIQEDITEKQRMTEELLRHRHHLEEIVASRTEQLAEAQQRADSANRSKSAFLANMSHEIRTPMNAIIGLTHLLRRADPTPPQAERLDKIEVAANHLLSIINDILDLSKIEAGKLQIEHTNFELSAVLNHVRSLIAEQALIKGLALTVDPDAVPLWLRGDPTRLRQALLNYASNAVKFTERGSIALRAVLLDERDDGLWLRFEVQDTGVGIAAEKLGGLFRAFEQADTSTTRQYGGTGLGLAITKHLALLMGGDAGADSVPGRGSTFWFTAVVQRGHGAMPAVSKARKDAETELRSSFFGARLLLAEDDSINREVALELLHAVGLTAEVACNGREALRMAARAHYDLVLMDMQMPQLNGLDATRAIRRLPGWSEIPILAMTANAFSGERMACEDAGMNDFIAKPVNPDALYRTLLRWLCTVPPAAPMASGTNPATAAPSTVDPTSTLRRLASIAGLSPARGLAGVRGNKALYLRVLRIFVHRGAETKRKLGGAIASEDLTELEQLAHNLKGSAGTLGAIELDNIATALQAEIRLRSSTTEAIRLGNALMGELVHLLEDLGTVLEEQ